MNPNSPPTYGNYGCMDTAALNFDIAATHPCSAGFPSFACANCNSQPDYCGPGTGYGQCCIYPQPVPGCTDLNACNYDATATTDDGSCEYISCVGCIDSTACNYDPTSTLDDGSCEYTSCLGCMVPTAVNYDQTATISCPNCCVLPIDGCTDVLAINYDVNANVDDGSCVYEVEPEKCSSQLDIGCWVCKDPINFPGCQQISNMNQVTMATGYGLQGFNNQQDCVNNTPCGKNPCDKVTLLNKINTQYNLGILEFCKYCNGGMIQDPSCKCCKRFQKDKKPKKDIMGEEIKRYKQLL